MPIYGEYDALFDRQLQTYIQNLKQAGKVIDCPEAYELAKVLDRENKDYAIKTQSRVFENLSFRANVIAYLKACLLYIAQGYTWTKVDEDFIRWSLRYDLWCKMYFFGEDIADAERGSNPEGRRGPRNLLNLLKATFSIQDAQQVRNKQGMTADERSTRKMVNTWMSRNYVIQKEDGIYAKCA